jgi:acyl-CoA thioester hydrolase
MVHITEIRVRYAETDRMQRVHHGAFVTYLEVARVECLRAMGFPYREMEDSGIWLPVKSMELEFLKPVAYDELLTIETRIAEPPSARLRFNYRVLTSSGEVAATAATELVFVDATTGRPRRAPVALADALSSLCSAD